MQVAVDQSVFASALGAVVRAIPGHNSMPILSGVYVQAAGGQLVLRATDLGLGVEHRLAAEVEQEGVAVLPAACLAQLVRRLPDERVRLAVGGELAAELRCGRSRFRLQGMAPDQFPACFSPGTEMVHIDVARGSLLEVLRRTAFVAPRQHAREDLTGVRLTLEGPVLRAVATDAVRVAHAWVQLSSPLPRPWAGTVPVRSVAELIRLLSGAETDRVEVVAEGNRMLCTAGTGRMESRLLEGAYPDVLRVLPQTYGSRVQMKRTDLLQALDRSLVLAEQSESCAVWMRFAPGQVHLRVQHKQAGHGSETLDVIAVHGELPDAISFNGRYLLEGLRAMGADAVQLEFRGAREPARMTGAGGDGFEYVLLPIMISHPDGE